MSRSPVLGSRSTDAGERGERMVVGSAGAQFSPLSLEYERYWLPWSVRHSIIRRLSFNSTTSGSCNPLLLSAGPCNSVLPLLQVLPSSSDRKHIATPRELHSPPGTCLLYTSP